MMPGRAVIAVAMLLWGAPLPAGEGDAAQKLRFKYLPDEKYRIVTEVDEDVLINGVLSHRSLILNKVAVETAEVKGGAGRLECDFQMSES
ncbi:MAG TPA: hypothetical protein PKN50_16830, partial [Spirochaetota bacterium]|nr:hypothetical protein [Spirochaetota bacterium]